MQLSTFIIAAMGFGCALAQGASPDAPKSDSPDGTKGDAPVDSKDGSKGGSPDASKGGASGGQVTVHVVKVGSADNALTYSPNKVKAAVGDMVQFQFVSGNHTVTQSTFENPCEPMAKTAFSNATGIFSGYMPIIPTSAATGSPAMMPTYTIMINNTTPIWIYCSQAKHCQKGMTMVINENAANPAKSLENYVALAAKAAGPAAPATPAESDTKLPSQSGVPSKAIPNGASFPSGKPSSSGTPKPGGTQGGNSGNDGNDKKPGENPPKTPFPSSGNKISEITMSTLFGALAVVLLL
uniref:Putative secreted effector protein CSEP008 n=1 Tax=Podosphaera xanthii TaxID=135283 RepID=A0A2U7MW91_9PEZI|nr:putative secreted effector protein CSEP008 [Podosphaera xanthii]